MPKRTVVGSGRMVPLNMRTTEKLRKQINGAAAKSGRSLVQEVSYRVERSFMRDEAHGEIERIRRHVLGMLNVTDGKVQRLLILVASIIHRLDEQMLRDNGAPMQNGTQPHA